MAYTVKAENKTPLGYNGPTFHVTHDGVKLGRLRIDRTGLVWFPYDQNKGHKISWEELGSHAPKIDPERETE